MVKKEVRKKSSSRKPSRVKGSHSGKKAEKLLVENFVSLQKVMVNLSSRFDNLAHQISELLKLFEDSAKVIVKGEIEKKNEDNSDKKILDTMVSLLDQNKIIAKGLTLMYETMIDSNAYSPKHPLSSVKKVVLPEKKKVVKENEEYSTSMGSRTPSSSFMAGS